jgi:hypothetical protein
MATNLSIMKPGLRTALAEALYNEILSNTNNYYYFIGKPLEWTGGEEAVETPENTVQSDTEVRREMVFMKKVTTADIAFTIPRYEWESGVVYDRYDDRLGDLYTVSAAAGLNSPVLTGTFDLSKFGVGWKVIGDGFADETYVDEATETEITLTKPVTAVVSTATFQNVSATGATSQEDSKFFVITSDYNVYKCLDNNSGAASTSKPYATTHEPVITADGYMWKYMYTIPNSLVNKFVTPDDIPVTTAVREAYYSNGSINSVRTLAYGSGYAVGDDIVFIGDGRATDNGYRLVNITVEDPGSGYVTPPTVTVTDPYENTVWSSGLSVLAGEYVKTTTNKIYRAANSGELGTSEPTHTSKIAVVNGNVALTFVGVTPVATATLNGDAVDTLVTMSGVIANVNIDYVGRGYDPELPPEVVISGDGVGASAYAIVASDGHIHKIVISSRGDNYSSASVTVDPPPTYTIDFDATSDVDTSGDTITSVGHPFVTGQLVEYDSNTNTDIGGLSSFTKYFIIVVDQDTIQLATTQLNAANGVPVDISSTSTGTHTVRSDEQGVIATVQLYYGYGYHEIPTVSASDPFTADADYADGLSVTLNDIIQSGNRFYTVDSTGTLGNEVPVHVVGSAACGDTSLTFIGRTASLSMYTETTSATGQPILLNGQIVGVNITDPGVGYTTAAVVVSGTGTGAVIEPNLDTGDLISRQASTELLAVPGSIEVIDVLHPGLGFSVASVEVVGDGSGCTATATIENGVVSKIVVTNAGSGYTFADVIITGNGGAGVDQQAYARAIISPLNGHGKDAVKELYATDISLSTTIANDRNQGFIVDNQYRQLGLIKNPTGYDSTGRISRITASPCHVITGDFPYSTIVEDMELTNADGARYIVVAKPATQPSGNVDLLVQAIDNVAPTVNMVLSYGPGAGDIAILSNVVSPTVDKYSGEMMFIDNRASFQPTDEQTVSIKTAIRL